MLKAVHTAKLSINNAYDRADSPFPAILITRKLMLCLETYLKRVLLMQEPFVGIPEETIREALKVILGMYFTN
jgi:hypothetical protein